MAEHSMIIDPSRTYGSLASDGSIAPKGIWHIAKVATPSRMLFVTLGAGTQHRPAWRIKGNTLPSVSPRPSRRSNCGTAA
jgi:hypothetical protein